jgi:hypothetical protein
VALAKIPCLLTRLTALASQSNSSTG